jgi:hypothetical protein
MLVKNNKKQGVLFEGEQWLFGHVKVNVYTLHNLPRGKKQTF